MPSKKTSPTTPAITNEEIYSAIISLQSKMVTVEAFEALKIKQGEHDEIIKEHAELMNGNGKPGFKSIRDKVLSWENKINAVTLLIVGDVALRLYQLAAK